MTNQEEASHAEIAAKLSRFLDEQIPASFVTRSEEVCGKPFAELTREDLSRLTMLTQFDSIEAESDQAQIEGELKRLNDDANFAEFVCTFSRGALVDRPALVQVSFPECLDSVPAASAMPCGVR